MSAILSTKKAAEQRLATLGIPTAYENAARTFSCRYLSVIY